MVWFGLQLCVSKHVLTQFPLPDESTMQTNRRFLIQVEPTLQSLQSQEDTDNNMQITIEDNGPKVHPELVGCF